MKYYLSLGSNLGNKKKNLFRAIIFLKKIGKINNISSIYKTSPVKMPEKTEAFFNLVLELETDYTPEKLLSIIKQFEKKNGRKTQKCSYESRIIDIDILLSDMTVVKRKELVIPHPEMANRAFVLIPLNEIAPDLIHPTLNVSIRGILTNLKTSETVAKIDYIPDKQLGNH
jgi:2-amino-4-hydroxy-6-hydroxymethyldihydropteridine diphosphokinase